MLQFIINVQVFFSMAFFSSPHKAKLGSKIKKLFWQFHYFSKAAAHITEHIASGAPDLFYRNLDIDQRFKIWVAKMVLMQDIELAEIGNLLVQTFYARQTENVVNKYC